MDSLLLKTKKEVLILFSVISLVCTDMNSFLWCNITAYAESKSITAPEIISFTASDSAVKMSWSDVIGIDGYEVFLWKNSKWKRVKFLRTKTNSCVISGLSPKTKYYFKLAAYKKVDTKYIVRSSSKIKSVTTKPLSPPLQTIYIDSEPDCGLYSAICASKSIFGTFEHINITYKFCSIIRPEVGTEYRISVEADGFDISDDNCVKMKIDEKNYKSDEIYVFYNQLDTTDDWYSITFSLAPNSHFRKKGYITFSVVETSPKSLDVRADKQKIYYKEKNGLIYFYNN